MYMICTRTTHTHTRACMHTHTHTNTHTYTHTHTKTHTHTHIYTPTHKHTHTNTYTHKHTHTHHHTQYIVSSTHVCFTVTQRPLSGFSSYHSRKEQLLKEVSLVVKLDHANVVRYFGASMEEDLFNIFQEWVAGEGQCLSLSVEHLKYTTTIEIPMCI